MQELKLAANSRKAILGSTTALVLAASAFAVTPAHAEVEYSGNISVVSDYVLRGITRATESDGPAVQGGIDLESDSGVYAGWWASSLGYGGGNLSTTVENDFYVGYAGESGSVGYDVGLIYYYYMSDSDASGTELALGFDFGTISVGMNYLLQDVTWGNQGDTYITAGTGFDLANDFSLGFELGYYIYEDSGKYIGSSGESSAFRHFSTTLSKPIADTPAEMFASFIIGGEDRDGVSQPNKVVIGFGYSF